jgi:hypothetical protein
MVEYWSEPKTKYIPEFFPACKFKINDRASVQHWSISTEVSNLFIPSEHKVLTLLDFRLNFLNCARLVEQGVRQGQSSAYGPIRRQF